MKNKQILLPTLIFITTLIIGLVAIIVTEQFQQKKITTTPRAQVSCITDPNSQCAPQVKRMVVDCPINGGTGRQECDVKFSYTQDPVCGTCVACGQPEPAPQSNCSPCIPDTTPTPPEERIITPEASPTPSPTIPIATNTPTPSPTTPAATRTPTPSVTQPVASVTPSKTPTPSVTTPPPSPTHSPTPSATPIPHACGYTPCDTASNQCASGLICVKANDNKYYCAQPAYEAACKTSPSVSSCCSAPTSTPTPGPSNTPQPGPSNTPGVTTIAQATNTPAAPTIPSAGVPAAWFFVAAPLLLVVLGLLF